MQGLPRWAFARCTASPPFQDAGAKRNQGALRAATLEAPQTSTQAPSRTESRTAAEVTYSIFRRFHGSMQRRVWFTMCQMLVQERHHEQYNWAAQVGVLRLVPCPNL